MPPKLSIEGLFDQPLVKRLRTRLEQNHGIELNADEFVGMLWVTSRPDIESLLNDLYFSGDMWMNFVELVRAELQMARGWL